MSNEFEMIKLVAMVIALVAFVNFPVIIKRNKDFLKFLPGITCLIMFFTLDFLEALFPIFELLEIIFVLVGPIFLCIAALIEFKELRLNKEKLKNDKLYQYNEGNDENE